MHGCSSISKFRLPISHLHIPMLFRSIPRFDNVVSGVVPRFHHRPHMPSGNECRPQMRAPSLSENRRCLIGNLNFELPNAHIGNPYTSLLHAWVFEYFQISIADQPSTHSDALPIYTAIRQCSLGSCTPISPPTSHAVRK